jgi:hypothetical protein
MKRVIFLALFFLRTVCAQDPSLYNPNVFPSGAIPPHPDSDMRGSLSFVFPTDEAFEVSLLVYGPPSLRVTSVDLFRSASSGMLGTHIATIPFEGFDDPYPGSFPGGNNYALSMSVSAEQRADILAGNWWVVASSSLYLDGEIRGKIIAVPEPSTIAFICFGITALTSCMRRGGGMAAF